MTTITNEFTRTVDGSAVPAAGTWAIDPAHTEVGFTARHLMVSKVRGHFGDVRGEISVGEDVSDSTVKVEIDPASISTGTPDRDQHLVSPDFLDVEAHPTISFVSTGVRPAGRNWILDGALTIRGITRPVELAVEFIGAATDPWGNAKAGFSASTEIDRRDWGLTWNAPLETGGVLVGEKVTIEIEAQLTLQS